MDYGDLCGLHFDSASVVKVNDNKEFIYDQYNLEFCGLMNINKDEYLNLSTNDIQLYTQLNGYKNEINSCNNQILNRIVNICLTDSVHKNKARTLTIKCNHKRPIHKKNSSKVIGIYTASVDKTSELALPCLYQHYLDFFDDRHQATKNFLRHLSIDKMFYRIPSVAEVKNYLIVGSCHLTIKEIAKLSGKSSATLNTQLQSFRKCLKSEFAYDNISLFKPFLKSFDS